MGFKSLAKPVRETAAQRLARRRLVARSRLTKRRSTLGWRVAPKTNKFGLDTRAAEKAKADRHATSVRAANRSKVWARSGGRCELACGMTERQTAEVHWKSKHEADEIVPRSLTRRQPPETRFATSNMARACRPCHSKRQTHQIDVIYDDESKGMDGSYRVVDHDTGKVLRKVER